SSKAFSSTMRAHGCPYLVAVASVIEIASCSETPAARTSCDHLSNWRNGLGSTEALVKGTGLLIIEEVQGSILFFDWMLIECDVFAACRLCSGHAQLRKDYSGTPSASSFFLVHIPAICCASA